MDPMIRDLVLAVRLGRGSSVKRPSSTASGATLVSFSAHGTTFARDHQKFLLQSLWPRGCQDARCRLLSIQIFAGVRRRFEPVPCRAADSDHVFRVRTRTKIEAEGAALTLAPAPARLKSHGQLDRPRISS